MIKQLLILFLLPLVAYADIDSVVGNISNSSSVSLIGESFGTKATVAPLIWDNFDEHSISNGDYLDGNGSWVKYGTNGCKFNNTETHSGQYAVWSQYVGYNEGGFESAYQEFTPSDEVYYSYWWYGGITSVVGQSDRSVVKLGRITSNYDGTHEDEPVYNPHYNTPCMLEIQNWMNDPDMVAPEAAHYWSQKYSSLATFGYDFPTMPRNAWHHVEMYLKLSTAGGTDGAIELIYHDLIHIAAARAEQTNNGAIYHEDGGERHV